MKAGMNKENEQLKKEISALLQIMPAK